VLQESEWYGRSSSGGATSLGFLGDEKLAAVFNEQELAVFTLGANQNFLMTKFSYTARGKTGEQIQGVLEASNRTAALFQVAKLGQGPIHVDEIKGVALTNGEPGAMITLLARPMMNPDSLEIRSLAVSGDGRRFAVAGMRMGKRQGVFQPAGTFVFDVPMHGEVQVWDAVGMKLLATLKGKPSEKFALVSLDGTGQRVAAVTTGVEYNSRMSDAAQQGAEWNPKAKASLRVCVWEVPVR
jgi:hypothetical protein